MYFQTLVLLIQHWRQVHALMILQTTGTSNRKHLKLFNLFSHLPWPWQTTQAPLFQARWSELRELRSKMASEWCTSVSILILTSLDSSWNASTLESLSGNVSRRSHKIFSIDLIFETWDSLVAKESPAALVGIRFGDQIVQIDGENLAGKSSDKALKLLKKANPQRCEVTITLNNTLVKLILCVNHSECTKLLRKPLTITLSLFFATGHCPPRLRCRRIVKGMLASNSAMGVFLTSCKVNMRLRIFPYSVCL